MSKVFGIVGNILYIEPFYGGDHLRNTVLTDYQKHDFIHYAGVKEYTTVKELEDDYWSYLDEILDEVNNRYE